MNQIVGDSHLSFRKAGCMYVCACTCGGIDSKLAMYCQQICRKTTNLLISWVQSVLYILTLASVIMHRISR